ncbi:hypothetical protein H4Q26_011603 [Puccinia striiformis f. sp. tritici PST-130]|nr:hypothetical protein H4Q26_011603 [Puccinia striiformis f. sp. tritici PST-130]
MSNLPKTEEEWRLKLDPEQFRILRKKGTEMAGTGEYNKHLPSHGVYECAGCAAPLYRYDHKLSLTAFQERSVDMKMTEITCTNCGGHLGHVFKAKGMVIQLMKDVDCVNSRHVRELCREYFTEDALLMYFNLSQIYSKNGRQNLKAAYQVSEQTEATIDLTQSVRVRLVPIDSVNVVCNFIVRLGLRKCREDNKYRIYRQQDNFPTDLTQCGLPLPQFIRVINDVIKALAWLFVVTWGRIFIMLGIF